MVRYDTIMAGIEEGQIFILPGTDDYERVIASVDETVTAEGGIRPLISGIRTARRNSENYYRYLDISQQHAFSLFAENDHTPLSDTDLVRARSVFTGMVMGHVVNEGLFPSLLSKKVYGTVGIPSNLFAPGASQKEVTRILETHRGRRQAFQAAAHEAFTRVGDDSQELVRGWAKDAGSDHPVPFMLGLGTALFTGYTYHARKYHRMLEAGEVRAFILEDPEVDPLA
jgi:hypothetical protein